MPSLGSGGGRGWGPHGGQQDQWLRRRGAFTAGCEAAMAKDDMNGAQGDFKLTAKIQNGHAASTIFAKAFDRGLWKNGGSAGQGKMLFLRNGKVCSFVARLCADPPTLFKQSV